MTTRLSLILLMTILSVISFASGPDTISMSRTLARPYEIGELPPKHVGRSAPLLDPGNLSMGSWTTERTAQWRVHLALELVRRPKLNEQQVRIILDAISSFAASADSNYTPTNTANADNALQALRRRALTAFSKNEVMDLFANSGKAEQDMLKRYYDISALPLKQRKASFRNASSKDKSDLWRTHLALFLVKAPELNEWQKEIILAAISLATAEYFEIPPNSPAWKAKVREPMRSLEEEILSAFSFEDGAKIFATLGDDAEAAKRSPALTSVLLNTISYRQLNDSHNRASAQDMFVERNPCQCSTADDWCPAWQSCNGGNCDPTSSGCGTLWRNPCNGASCQ